MLTQLTTVKNRLGLSPVDPQYDAMLTGFIEAVSARFDRETRRTLARTVNATQEFRADETLIILAAYPLETIAKYEIKTSEADGWILITPSHLLRRYSIVELLEPVGSPRQLMRITYTGGYVLPGTVAEPSQWTLPKDLEHAATEQVAGWFQTREMLGLTRHWPEAGNYDVISLQPLLTSVQATVRRHERWVN